jgi:hypothetical protein
MLGWCPQLAWGKLLAALAFALACIRLEDLRAVYGCFHRNEYFFIRVKKQEETQ